MRKFSFILNTVLTTLAIAFFIYKENTFNYDEYDLFFLMILGAYQVLISMAFSIISIAENKKLVVLYLVYWVLVVAFCKLLLNVEYSYCILLALYSLYLNYCGFSKSKFNLVKP